MRGDLRQTSAWFFGCGTGTNLNKSCELKWSVRIKATKVIKDLRNKIIMMLIWTDWNFHISQKELPLFYLNLYYIILLGIWIWIGIGIWIGTGIFLGIGIGIEIEIGIWIEI